MKNIISKFLGDGDKPTAKPPEAVNDKAGSPRNDELDYYDQVWAELETGAKNRGLWARCYAEADGDPEKARARYLKARVAQLVENDDSRHQEQMVRIREQRSAEAEEKRKQQAIAEENARALKEKQTREEAERLRLEKEKRRKEERRHGLHGRAVQEEQRQEDFVNLVERVRVQSKGKRLQIEAQSVDHWGCTRLIRAAQKGRYDDIVQMIADGDNPLEGDANGMPARAHAEVQGHEKCAQFLDVAEQVWEKNRGSI